jgi:hypothetical protein
LRPAEAGVDKTSAHPSYEKERLGLDERLGLRIDEAAASIGLSKRAFEEHILPRCPKFYAGRAVVIPKRPFERFIEALALEEQQQTQETAAELLHRVDRRSR